MDKERLVRRTQTQRSEYRVLGKPEPITPEIDSSITEGEVRHRLAFKRQFSFKGVVDWFFSRLDCVYGVQSSMCSCLVF